MKQLQLLIVMILGLSLSTAALARRDRREGFNFGLGLRAIDSSADTNGSEAKGDQKRLGGVQSVAPYVGYVLAEHINIGLTGVFENETTQDEYKSQDGKQEIKRETTSSLRGGSLFLRFLFANMMYFEGGAGIYDRRQKFVEEYYTRDGDGAFSGERDEYSMRGLGPGYHAAAGVEFAITNGFFFTTNYTYRAVQLRDYQGSGSIGKKRSRLENREVNFGFSHYVN
jgi:opacity protein-like surface antigen